jgi:hypothetical protein
MRPAAFHRAAGFAIVQIMRFGKVLKKYFIPHNENDFKPHFFRSEIVSIMIGVVFLIELLVIAQVYISYKTNFLALILPNALVDLTNTDRAENSLKPLAINPQLVAAAQLKASDMASRGYFSHNTPEGREPWYWLEQVGYKYSNAGENLAVNFFDSVDVENAWMNSPGHRANIVKSNYTEIGIATANGFYQGRPTTFVVQFFGTPKQTFAQQGSSTPPTQPKPTPVKKPIAQTPTSTVSTTSTTSNPGTITQTPTSTAIAQVKAAETTHRVANPTSVVRRILTSPRSMNSTFLTLLLILVACALTLTVIIEVHIQHKKILLNGVGLIAVIALGLIINTQYLKSYTQVTTLDDFTQNVSIETQ